MITISNNEAMDDLDLVMKKALTELRRGHVSRFPINVDIGRRTLWFWDSRFPRAAHTSGLGFIASVSREEDGDKVDYKIMSKEIVNDRYASYNDKRNVLSTKNPTKLLQHMKKYIVSTSDERIADATEYEQMRGREEYEADLRNRWYGPTPSVTSATLMREMVELKRQGIVPTTPLLKAYYDKLPEYETYQEVLEKQPTKVHVHIQSDDLVTIWNGTKSTNYAALSECPDNIQQAVAMLNIMEKGAYVPNVGTKTRLDGIYWVEVFED